jgi:hypothetical protein
LIIQANHRLPRFSEQTEREFWFFDYTKKYSNQQPYNSFFKPSFSAIDDTLYYEAFPRQRCGGIQRRNYSLFLSLSYQRGPTSSKSLFLKKNMDTEKKY